MVARRITVQDCPPPSAPVPRTSTGPTPSALLASGPDPSSSRSVPIGRNKSRECWRAILELYRQTFGSITAPAVLHRCRRLASTPRPWWLGHYPDHNWEAAPSRCPLRVGKPDIDRPSN